MSTTGWVDNSALGSDKLAATSLIDLVNSGNLSRMPMQHQGNVLSDYFRVVAGIKEENAQRYNMQLPIFFDNDLIVFQSENASVNNLYFTEPWSFLSQPEPNEIVDNATHEIWNDMYYELEGLTAVEIITEAKIAQDKETRLKCK